MNTQWIDNARAAFSAVYGDKKGAKVCAAVIPGIMGDFRKMLTRAADGVPVAEDYRTDDLKADIHIEGRRTGDRLSITSLTVGGTPVELGADELAI